MKMMKKRKKNYHYKNYFYKYTIINSDNYINNGKTSKDESEKITEEKKDA